VIKLPSARYVMNKISDEKRIERRDTAGKLTTVNLFLKEEIHAFFRYKHQKKRWSNHIILRVKYPSGF
jgi:hypothetical protein